MAWRSGAGLKTFSLALLHWKNVQASEELIAALLGNRIRTVLIEKLDRLTRDTIVSEIAVAYSQRNEFELVSTCEPDLCASTDPTRVLFRTTLAAFSVRKRHDRAQTQGSTRENEAKRPDLDARSQTTRVPSRRASHHHASYADPR